MVLSVAVDPVFRRVAKGTRNPKLGTLVGLPIGTGSVAGAWPFDLAAVHRRKSAATGLGVLLAISLPVGIGAAVVWGVVLAISRIVSLSSILAALTAIVLVFSFQQPMPYRLLVVTGGLYVIVRHRANIQRLLAGAEPQLGQGSSESKSNL
jgi:hypothetical protein